MVIRDRCCLLGDISPVENTDNQMLLDANINLDKPIKFMFTEAVEKNNEISPNTPIESPDTKTNLKFRIASDTANNITNYTVSVEGQNERSEMRIRAVVGGFIKYGGCERVDFNKFKFSQFSLIQLMVTVGLIFLIPQFFYEKSIGLSVNFNKAFFKGKYV